MRQMNDPCRGGSRSAGCRFEALKPDPRNARVHSDRQVALIADSIRAFGFNVPVLVDEKGGLLAGHGRALAARRLGLAEVPTISLGHLTETERRAFIIADNRLGELASWDDAQLRVEFEELKVPRPRFLPLCDRFRDQRNRPPIRSGSASLPPGRAGRARDAISDRALATRSGAIGDRALSPSRGQATSGRSGPIVWFAATGLPPPPFSRTTPLSEAGRRRRGKARVFIQWTVVRRRRARKRRLETSIPRGVAG